MAKQKRILLVIDNSVRDLMGIALLAHKLISKFNYYPIITTTQNEFSMLVKYKPQAIVMPHVRYERNENAIKFAQSQGTKIFVLPVEGYPPTDDWLNAKVVGLEKFFPLVDGLLSWGQYVKEFYERNHDLLPQAEIDVTGCPRFDYLSYQYDVFFRSREEFCKDYDLNADMPIIIWFSDTSYAHIPDPEQWAQDRYQRGSGKIIKGLIDFAALARDHQLKYEHTMELFKQLISENPQYNYLVKPHPHESYGPYIESLKDMKQVRVINTNEQSVELVRYSDVQINSHCTTSIEKWMRDVNSKVISIEPSNLEIHDLADMAVGNVIANDYDQLRSYVNGYLNGATVTDDLISKREDFIMKYFCSNDGNSSDKVVDAIFKYLANKSGPQRNLICYKNILVYLLKKVKNRQFRMIDIARGIDHDKYFPPERFHNIMDKLNNIFNVNVNMQNYSLEI